MDQGCITQDLESHVKDFGLHSRSAEKMWKGLKYQADIIILPFLREHSKTAAVKKWVGLSEL